MSDDGSSSSSAAREERRKRRPKGVPARGKQSRPRSLSPPLFPSSRRRPWRKLQGLCCPFLLAEHQEHVLEHRPKPQKSNKGAKSGHGGRCKGSKRNRSKLSLPLPLLSSLTISLSPSSRPSLPPPHYSQTSPAERRSSRPSARSATLPRRAEATSR